MFLQLRGFLCNLLQIVVKLSQYVRLYLRLEICLIYFAKSPLLYLKLLSAYVKLVVANK